MDSMIIIELHSFVEANALITAIQKQLDALADGCTRKDVIDFLALQNIALRISPKIDALVERKRASE